MPDAHKTPEPGWDQQSSVLGVPELVLCQAAPALPKALWMRLFPFPHPRAPQGWTTGKKLQPESITLFPGIRIHGEKGHLTLQGANHKIRKR